MSIHSRDIEKKKSIRGRNSDVLFQKMTHYNPNYILSMLMCIQNLVSTRLFFFQGGAIIIGVKYFIHNRGV